MSAGQGFDIALLEGKDRSELAAIAEQLGEKPGARAKKADIVALIVRLVGGDPADAGGASEAAGDDASDEASAAEAPAEDGADDEAHTESADRAGGEAEGDGADAGDDRGPRDADQGDQGGEGGDGAPTDADGVEPGNRRRRRRGRDRDRRPEGEDAPAEPVLVEGMVDLRDEGYGFLRLHGYLPSRDDAYISVKQTRQFGLRTGDLLTGKSRPPARNEKNPALLQVDTVNGHEVHNQPPRPHFQQLTPVFPDEPLTLARPGDPKAALVRAIDVLAPLGKGSRGLVVGPPKSGKTAAIKEIAISIEANHPDVDLFVLLLDERPEEATDLARAVTSANVVVSTFDRSSDEHTTIAELAMAQAKRLVEQGRDVVVLIDGLTRIARAYNLTVEPTERTLAGGIEATAVHRTRQIFGAARKAEEGGSLTIVATAQVGPDRRSDDLIFEELMGTESLEIRLDRTLADRGVVPAIDVVGTSSRHDDLLIDAGRRDEVARLRQDLAARAAEAGNAAAVQLLQERLGE